MKLKIVKSLNLNSIRVKLTLTLAILITATIGVLWVMNRSFLQEYYINSKAASLGKTFKDIKAVYDTIDTNNLTDDDNLKMEKEIEYRSLSVYVVNTSTNIWYEKNQWYSAENESPINRERYSQIVSSIFSILMMEKDVVKDMGDYQVFKYYNATVNTNYLALLGQTEDGGFILIRTSFETMRESVVVANEFLAYVGVIAVIISILVMLWISKKFTGPILQLAGIAKKMSDLNFEVKYDVNSEDELGELGGSINILSEKLESTISELKSANNELLSDLQHKVRIDEMRKDFLSNVTHELKTPIALIQGYAEGLKDNISDDQDNKDFYCEVIIDEAQKMNSMVKKLLSLNQIEFGNNQPNIERYDLTALIKSVIHSTEILLEQKRAMIYFEQNEPLYVWADEYMIEEVLTNYISNALNHVDGPRAIEVKLIPKDEVVRVAVFNSGLPIPEEDLENIWIKFYKVDKARTREYGGSGIGLSIVKAIMESHNKKCGAINHKNGVEFWFELDRQV